MNIKFLYPPTLFSRFFAFLFDLKKKLDMNRLYAKYHDPWGTYHRQKQVDKAMGLLPPKQYSRCLDVGCGLGDFAQAASGFCDAVVAIDISPLAVEKALCRLSKQSNIQFHVKNIRTYNPDFKFDLIILGDVLYYLGDKIMESEFKKILKKISDMLEIEGRILITHYIAPWRNATYFRERYINNFKNLGIVVEREAIYTDQHKSRFHCVLKKEK